MRILFIGRYCSSQSATGGNTLYQHGLAHCLAETEDVYYVSYEGLDFSGKTYINRYNAGKIHVYDIVNSPLYDYSNTDPKLHLKCPEMHRLFFAAYNEIKPDIVHVHDTFLPATVYESISCPVIQTIHNYVHVCPQVNLYYKGREICSDFKNGTKCVECYSAPVPNKSYFLTMRTRYTLFKYRLKPLLNILEWLLKIIQKRHNRSTHNMPQEGTEQSVQQRFHAEDYKMRREKIISVMKKHFTLFHCTSTYLREYLISYGIDPSHIKVIPITSPQIHHIKPKGIRGSGGPVNFGYFGGNQQVKGIRVLMEAFSKLDSDRARLHLFGSGINLINTEDERIIRHTQTKEIWKHFKLIDVGIIPSVWNEPFGLIGVELNNARIPMIASNTGGFTEWLQEGVNGFGIRPGSVGDLVEKMKLFIEDPSLIARLQMKMRPWKTFRQHVDEIYGMYNNILNIIPVSSR